MTSATDLHADAFRAHLGDRFSLSAPGVKGGEAIEVDLVDVSGLGGDTAREDRSPFSLLFRGPAERALEQGIYRFQHEAMGTMDLFLVCVGPDPEDRQMRYEVIFS